jgi:lipopolysaccharide/colanic/teichoic acid biosynthesis glycosyltransferase
MKRAFDLVAGLAALVLTSPVMLAAALAVRLGPSGPAFYSGPRVGRGGTEFQIHKLRSMTVGAAQSGPAVTAGDDARVTGVGRFLRRTKIDELPQLWNVVKGEMSLVGPRPEHPDYVRHYTAEQRRLLSVRPGMTGPAALEFYDEEERLKGADPEARYLAEVMPQKLALELSYLDKAGLWSDLKILLRTVVLVFRRLLPGSRRGAR